MTVPAVHDREYWTRKAMRRFGHGFVKSVADSADTADVEQLARLKDAFPDIWEKYAGLGVELEKELKAECEGDRNE